MLRGMRANRVEYKFYESKIGLPEFLTINYGRSEHIGDYTYHLKLKFLRLLQFHTKN